MREKILELRAQGYTYNQIVQELGCSKGTVAYHCGDGQKAKSQARQVKRRQEKSQTLEYKAKRVLSDRRQKFQIGTPIEDRFSMKDLIEFLENNAFCYLTGTPIDLNDISSYEFDHIIPRSKGGSNKLSNLGLLLTDVNRMKNSLMIEDLFQLCGKILEYKNNMC